MRKKKSNQPPQSTSPDADMKDTFFRRIQVQNAVIKKMLSEIDRPALADNGSVMNDEDK